MSQKQLNLKNQFVNRMLKSYFFGQKLQIHAPHLNRLMISVKLHRLLKKALKYALPMLKLSLLPPPFQSFIHKVQLLRMFLNMSKNSAVPVKMNLLKFQSNMRKFSTSMAIEKFTFQDLKQSHRNFFLFCIFSDNRSNFSDFLMNLVLEEFYNFLKIEFLVFNFYQIEF